MLNIFLCVIYKDFGHFRKKFSQLKTSCIVCVIRRQPDVQEISLPYPRSFLNNYAIIFQIKGVNNIAAPTTVPILYKKLWVVTIDL